MMPTPLARRFRLIVAGVDFSPESARALRYAVAIARRCGGHIVALHAVDPLLEAAAARAYAARAVIADTRAELHRFAAKALGPEVAATVEYSIGVGTSRDVLTHECTRRHADVVVLGTHGRGGLPKLFFGSTTEALLRRYHGAVMVVPRRCADPDEKWPGGAAVGAVAPGLHHRAMMSAASRTAEVFGCWLTVVPPELPHGHRRWHPAPLVILPMPDSARLETFRQGTRAYEFVRGVGVPVLVMHTGRRIGHVEVPKKVA
jgi:nucleotide-binding universal stress UspA family protein